MKRRKRSVLSAVAAIAVVVWSGCGPQRHAILASTATSIGVDVSQDPATQSPHAKLGYQRMELAVVPTNRSANEDAGSTVAGASSHGDVLMELRYGGIFDLGESSGIYQRLAVGKNAVEQPGAALMFAKDADGDLNGSAVLTALKSIPSDDPADRARVAAIARLRGCHGSEIDAAIKEAGLNSYNDLADGKADRDQLAEIEKAAGPLAPCVEQ